MIQVLNQKTSLESAVLHTGSLTVRPHSPYPETVPGSTITIIIDHFGRPLRFNSVIDTLFEARLLVGERIMRYGPLALVEGLSPWGNDKVIMTVTPLNRLNWYDLATALKGILNFVSTFESFEFDFDIMYQGFKKVGKGQLKVKE